MREKRKWVRLLETIQSEWHKTQQWNTIVEEGYEDDNEMGWKNEMVSGYASQDDHRENALCVAWCTCTSITIVFMMLALLMHLNCHWIPIELGWRRIGLDSILCTISKRVIRNNPIHFLTLSYPWTTIGREAGSMSSQPRRVGPVPRGCFLIPL